MHVESRRAEFKGRSRSAHVAACAVRPFGRTHTSEFNNLKKMERAKGFEPSTPTLARSFFGFPQMLAAFLALHFIN
jgi:hypothetical protein